MQPLNRREWLPEHWGLSCPAKTAYCYLGCITDRCTVADTKDDLPRMSREEMQERARRDLRRQQKERSRAMQYRTAKRKEGWKRLAVYLAPHEVELVREAIAVARAGLRQHPDIAMMPVLLGPAEAGGKRRPMSSGREIPPAATSPGGRPTKTEAAAASPAPAPGSPPTS